MNVSNLILKLKSEVDGNTCNQQMISKAIKLLQVGAVVSVASVSALPAVASNTGKLYYVDYDGLYYSTGQFWVRIATTSISSTWAWGCSTCGSLGDGNTTNSSSPVSVTGGFIDWCQVSAGVGHSLGIRTNGSLWAWGCNSTGQLGINTTVHSSSPVSVFGGFTDWCQVSAGRRFSAAVRTNGTLWTWGINIYGQLGDNTTVSKRSPVSVVGGFTDWRQVSLGYTHAVAVRSNGTLWGWGCNGSGRIGDGTTVSRLSPVSVVGGFTDWCQVSAGREHTLAVRTNGTAWAWGRPSEGQLGTGNTANASSPVSVVGGFTDWCQVSAGRYHSLAVRINGSLWSWGAGSYGRLGNNCASNFSSPVSVVGGFTDWCQASAGEFNSGAVRQNGTIWTWGNNTYGQLGDGTTTSRSSPVSILGGISNWCRVSVGCLHALAIRNISL